MIRAAALLLIATSAAAQDAPTPAAPTVPAASPTPEPMRHAVVLLEFTGKGKYLGTPLICPGEDKPLPEGAICMSSMYDQPIAITRKIAGPSIRGDMLRYKIVEWGFPEGATILAAVMPNPEKRGLYAPWWKMPEDDSGRFCLEQREAEYLKIVPEWSRWKLRKPRKDDGGDMPLMRCIET